MAIVVTAAEAFFRNGLTVRSGSDLALQLEPLFGGLAKYFIGIGLFAAGISSAITAPLAAAYATAGIFGWSGSLKSWTFRAVWIFILLSGFIFAVRGFPPLQAILFAQAANGIILPVIAVYLLVVMNSRKIMGSHCNSLFSNLLSFLVVLITFAIGIRTLLSAFRVI